MKIRILPFFLVLVAGCTTTAKKAEAPEIRIVNDTIPMTRTRVDPAPVATYSTDVPDELNKFKFSVKLFETPLRFRYRVAIRYKMMDVKDSVDIPNFGLQPRVGLRKHGNELACMIGFHDKDGRFMDLKKVEVIKNQLRIRQVKRYGLGTVRKN